MIQVFYKNQYLFTSTQFKTIRELKAYLIERENASINIASIPNKTHKIDDIKHYTFKRLAK